MKSVLISIQPKWCELIANGKKTIEVRKTRPKIETPFKVYIYCTYGNEKENYCVGKRGKVIGEFVCDKIEEFHEHELSPSKKFYEFEKARLDLFLKESCLSYNEVCDYRRNLPYYKPLYAWHISKLKIYDKPKELVEFRKCDIYCGDCKHIVLPTDRLSLSDCDRRCDKFNKDLLFYDSFNRCEECLELNTITRPPQSWCYVEE